MQTEAVEDYLKTIYNADREQRRVTTTILAERLGVAPASVTGMLKKLAGMNLVTYEPYHGVALTPNGRKIALEVIRHHRLIELYLTRALAVPWDQVHAEAEKWEHVLSEDIEERIDTLLGHPKFDPHGAPIPERDGTIATTTRVRLADLASGQSAILAEVSDSNPDLLRYAASLGLYPGVKVYVVAKGGFDGTLTMRVGDLPCLLGREAAIGILVVEVVDDSPEAR